MKKYGKMEVKLHVFLISEVDEAEDGCLLGFSAVVDY